MSAPRPGFPSDSNGAVAWHPGRLCSLKDIMHHLHVSSLCAVCKTATAWSILQKNDHSLVSKQSRLRYAKAIESYIENLRPMGMSASCSTLRKMKDSFETKGCKASNIAKLSLELIGRLIDETDDTIFFTLSPGEADFYKNPNRGWELAIDRFAIRGDVEEASKCFALSRYSAAVFHSVQAVETG
jgi:hypothetical protein